MTEINDDLGTAKPPFKVVAVIPVHERLELLPYTIKRLIHKNGVQVICVGDGVKEKAICIESGAKWVAHQNKPLGAKWNAGFLAAKSLNPDAVLYVGSSDWVCDDWVTIMRPYMEAHQMVGVPGCYFLDIGNELRAVSWKGYTGDRSGETIGIGRMISAGLLDKINWKPFDGTKDNSLDRSMKEHCAKHNVDDFFVHDDRLKAVSISTDKWQNKHVFAHHWSNILPSEKIEARNLLVDFPEVVEFYKTLYAH